MIAKDNFIIVLHVKCSLREQQLIISDSVNQEN